MAEGYLDWVRRFLRYSQTTPGELDETTVRRFLEHLALRRNVSASTRNQALGRSHALRKKWRAFLPRQSATEDERACSTGGASRASLWPILGMPLVPRGPLPSAPTQVGARPILLVIDCGRRGS